MTKIFAAVRESIIGPEAESPSHKLLVDPMGWISKLGHA